jgi:hypothetical protein
MRSSAARKSKKPKKDCFNRHAASTQLPPSEATGKTERQEVIA